MARQATAGRQQQRRQTCNLDERHDNAGRKNNGRQIPKPAFPQRLDPGKDRHIGRNTTSGGDVHYGQQVGRQEHESRRQRERRDFPH
jgi:hypothetical protein